MLNPENSVNTVDQAINRVLECACDNVNNKLLVFQCGHIFMALKAMRRTLGIYLVRWPKEVSERIPRPLQLEELPALLDREYFALDSEREDTAKISCGGEMD